MKKIFVFMLCLAIAASTMLCSCEKDNEQEDEITTITSSEPDEPMPYPFMLNDVEIAARPEKVVCLSPAITEIICEMGYQDTIIGRSSYCDFPGEIISVTDVGSTANPDIKAIIELKPDLVISSTAIASKDIFEMEQQGIKTVIIPSPTALDGFSSIYTSIGLIYEGMFTGVETGEQYYSEINKVLGNTDNFSFGKFVYITENYSVAGGNTIESAILSCFGTNLAKDAEGYGFDAEALLENQPDILLVNSKYSKEMLEEHEVFSELNAFQENRIIYIDNFFFERPTARIMEAITQLKDLYRILFENRPVDDPNDDNVENDDEDEGNDNVGDDDNNADDNDVDDNDE